MRDYSEHGEQAHILKFFEGKVGRFLDIGAFNGIQISNTRALLEIGWTGIYVEANPPAFMQLLRHTRGYSAMCVLAAVMPSNGHAFLWDTTEVNERDPCWSEGGQCCTAFPRHNVANRVRQRFGIGCVTVDELAKAYGEKFDFISIDIEGMDLDVLKTMGQVLKGCELLCFEETVPGTDFDQGYYDQLLSVCALHGFNRVIARCKNNTLIAKP